MGKIWLGGTELKRVWCGQNEIVKIWQGSTLLWEKSGSGTGGDTGGGGGGGGGDEPTTHTLIITSVSVADIPASGGSVSSCTVYYTLDGSAKSTTKSFTDISGSDLGTTETSRTQKGYTTVSVTDGGVTKSTTVYVYQEANYVTNTSIISRGDWYASGGSIGANGGSIAVSTYQKCTAKYTYKSGSSTNDDNYHDPISVTWSADGTVCTGVSGSNGTYSATISKNNTTLARYGSATATYSGQNKSVTFYQEAATEVEKKAIDYLSVTATQVAGSPSGVCTVTIENTSNRKINFTYRMGSRDAASVEERSASVDGGKTWGGGGYWSGLVSASFA